jgi:hypothetical protein
LTIIMAKSVTSWILAQEISLSRSTKLPFLAHTIFSQIQLQIYTDKLTFTIKDVLLEITGCVIDD